MSQSELPSLADLADLAVNVEPYGVRSEVILKQGDHALFGVSTGNSYFSRQRLANAISWAAEHFEVVDVIYADLYLDAMSEAFGYQVADARRSATKHLRGVRRRIQGALEDVGKAADQVRARPLSDFLEEPAYQEVRTRALAALRTDTELRTVRDEMAYQFLAKKLDPGTFPTTKQVQVVLSYVDAELPFFVDSPRVLGVASSVHCYHTVLALGRLLFSDRAAGLGPADNQGYAIVTCQD
ncbi:tRNA-dependent cyclodipeptide synthase [Streptomyces sp. NPDC058001]|uniref:tRNA-dependent cyclodipeptide synthase n=1 Tax=Streptomyces sp. NPDC058001 TaxID=3346300 RepID=UPI0036E5E38C